MTTVNTMPEQDAALDLSQFHQIFFEEALENLEVMERQLLALDPQGADAETLNAIFRCAHSVKGGGATFGFESVASLTHAMETLLDRLRRGELAPTMEMVDVLLVAGDQLRAMLVWHRDGGTPPEDSQALLARLERLAQEAPGHGRAAASPAAGPVAAAPAAAAPAGGMRDLQIVIGPLSEGASTIDDLFELFSEVQGSGTLTREPPLPQQPADHQRLRLLTTATDEELVDLCSFHVPRESIQLSSWPAAPEAQAVHQVQEAAESPVPAMNPAAQPAVTARRAPTAETLRVSLAKVDHLINLMGELVITQSVLAQGAQSLDGPARQMLHGGLADLERTARDLQDSVMAMRMIPMGDVFNRFPRMLRELAARLGKQLELHTAGESTELDKGLIEKITDPLTHLVRNAVDHGIEMPEERVAAGKPPHGNLTLSARHEGGSIVIEVNDDGRGLDRDRILAKARSNGIAVADDASDREVWDLIFAPGFSTASEVTDISGRGVGMDVVRRNIDEMGGSVELLSVHGKGTCVRVRLPLTLAIMDGMCVGIGSELYVLPLASVVESFQVQEGSINTVAGTGRVVRVRSEWLPVRDLSEAMGDPLPHGAGSAPILVLVQSGSHRLALQVERIVSQQQVVVKNLEANYRKIPGVSGATIMGDGRVALILDVAALARSTTSLH